MNTLLKFNFPEPVKIDFDSDFTTEEASFLEVADSPKGEFLSVQLLLQEYPEIIKTVILYSGEEYTTLGDWTYQTLINRIRTYYKCGMGFPSLDYEEPTAEAEAQQPAPEPETSEAPAEEVAPEAETSEPAPEEPAPTEEVVATTTKRSKR